MTRTGLACSPHSYAGCWPCCLRRPPAARKSGLRHSVKSDADEYEYYDEEIQQEDEAVNGLLSDMRAAERQRREASATSFYFLHASKVRGCSMERLPRLQDLKSTHPDWVVKEGSVCDHPEINVY